MPLEIRHARKVYRGVTTADLARKWGITPQAADKRVHRPEAPAPIAVIATLDDAGRVIKRQTMWDPTLWGL